MLATAATTGQLITNCFQIAITISELRDRVKNAPLRFAQYARYFEQLDTTAKDIRNNPNLQSQVVYSFVSATLKETEAAQIVLDRFLKSSRKRRYLGVINGRLERNINEHLDNLDRIVQAFCLCISSMTTKQVELSVTRGIERVRQQLTESIHGRELAVSLTSQDSWWFELTGQRVAIPTPIRKLKKTESKSKACCSEEPQSRATDAEAHNARTHFQPHR